MNETMSKEKKAVYEYWNINPCITGQPEKRELDMEYFEEMERLRYDSEPYIWDFAQFTRYSGKKILEIGIGVGTDFIQWVRAGCIATGCDLTQTAVEYTKKRLETYNLSAEVRPADCENLPFGDESFDLVYSFGVIHHTPDTEKAVSEICRVIKKGGTAKVMLYHRRSWFVFRYWIDYALKKLRPFRSIDKIISVYYRESPCVKIYSAQQAKQLFRQFAHIETYVQLTPYDFSAAPKIAGRRVSGLILRMLSNKVGWNLMITAIK